ncbi:hypothetical protein SteCoe_30134 [Stentor coeruleus]|uniref:Uncharacterized protein n=1 Tax=Stentor coeruleus TaxID=5963 RepID=A0A1R2B489_9CILI|nr:hypothetical protein SteCoe_30134 [Stentor coeruleus]
MLTFLLTIALSSANLRGNYEDLDLGDMLTQSFFLQTTSKDQNSDIKSLISQLLSEEKTYISDFTSQCEEFIAKYANEGALLQEIIVKNEKQLELLDNTEDLQEKLEEVNEKINQFTDKIIEIDQNNIEEQVNKSQELDENQQQIQEIQNAIDYLEKLVGADSEHVSEVLEHIVSIKKSLEVGKSFNKNDLNTEKPLVSNVLSDLYTEKSQIEKTIEVIKSERVQVESYLNLVKPQLDAVNDLINTKKIQCEKAQKIIDAVKDIEKQLE